MYKKIIIVPMLWLLMMSAVASIDVHEFDSLEQEMRYRALIQDFRCPTCQNQNLAGSDAPIAQDLKQKTYEMIKEGRTDSEIHTFMVARYGDFISYKPPVRPSTWILWFFPPVLLVVMLLAWIYHKQKRQKPKPVVVSVPLSGDEEARLANLLASHAKSDGADAEVQQSAKPPKPPKAEVL